MLIGCCAKTLVFTFHLDDSMANVSVYGVAMAANVLAIVEPVIIVKQESVICDFVIMDTV